MSHTPTVMRGSDLAAALNDETRTRAIALPFTPTLATVLVGDDPGSHRYVQMKQRRCADYGLASRHVHLPATTATAELVDLLTGLGRDPGIHGVLLQHPLPASIDERVAFDAIPTAKDVDGTSSASFAAAALDEPGHRSCTPAGIIRLLDHDGITLAGADVTVVGRSSILGRPLAAMLTTRDATVTVCHSRTRDLTAHARRAEVLIVAAGRPGLVGADMVRPGAAVVDAGFTPGDVAPDVAGVAGALTPVPGGVGPMTIAMLLAQTVDAAEKQSR
ncbi:bifunctional 5,10-methylenetetrahydrofolate dehydrogenase/5,10-methenyltetrahydrofolate cyclohydrolase [Tsukamurella sp. 8F]|uniref:bifunctional 5,10-methylenetetrahydrofolate dehydrogenase/5,10-methenyltetrahydrofolate cyclohydrolase n=1 Tax=unclassified Tsukamurella TaxID=2633480 RepID=UPI0023B89850|nr:MULTISPECIES: bifunctional 5,10-methylenetetrahydrofolate dehydrogenase/5,10-methenyltetrahydrofolate cyclohydrolase [unclassified Tsukamurella]MDF0528466.1 bifunctional 5,10-methylenetetrahydrofolate dehydrogenase/5,10-methenyltetrahydrofolate cyclohydrolase [Tsukamurella sp. 8J]MDF0586292.1 bifunctional 5,10-methylenetetrahydrofolate dehydrogenase/5,10-methenyltetrahydrofolate cyclohydrolase [Tsukamurella sp. 8F]